VEEIPEQEDVCVVGRLRSEKIVRLNRDLTVLDRLGLILVPVLRKHRQCMRSNVDINFGVLTAMA